jgi:hypothetical protein
MRDDDALERELENLIADEAALLDAGRHDEWLALFAEGGRYWVPLLGARQADRHAHNSLADEDRLLLALRIERLKHPRAHSQHPRSSCQHVLQRSRREAFSARAASDGAGASSAGANTGTVTAANPRARDVDEAVMRTPFLYLEARDGEPLLLAGSYRHHFVRVDNGWKILLKRVDLLDPERPLPAIQLFI